MSDNVVHVRSRSGRGEERFPEGRRVHVVSRDSSSPVVLKDAVHNTPRYDNKAVAENRKNK